MKIEKMKRSENYKNIFDSDSGFMRAKDGNGKFKENFAPPLEVRNIRKRWHGKQVLPQSECTPLTPGKKDFVTFRGIADECTIK